MKKSIILVLLGIGAFTTLNAEEQYTRMAVVDLAKVYSQFAKDSKEAKELEDLKVAIKKENDRMVEEIKNLRAQKAEALTKNDSAKANDLEGQIKKKEAALAEYRQVKGDQYNARREAVMKTDVVLKKIIEEIDFIAKAQGFAMVFNTKVEGLLYYNQEVDITEDVIKRLSGTK